jgi:hypothetical protein
VEFCAVNLFGSTNNDEIVFFYRSCSLQPFCRLFTCRRSSLWSRYLAPFVQWPMLSARSFFEALTIIHGDFFFLSRTECFLQKLSACQDPPGFKVQYARQTCGIGRKTRLCFGKLLHREFRNSQAKTCGRSKIEWTPFARCPDIEIPIWRTLLSKDNIQRLHIYQVKRLHKSLTWIHQEIQPRSNACHFTKVNSKQTAFTSTIPVVTSHVFSVL